MAGKDRGQRRQACVRLALLRGYSRPRILREHPGATVERAREVEGWDLRVTDKVTISEPPTDEQLEVLRGLHARTSATRGVAS